jgi:hypothetical protein
VGKHIPSVYPIDFLIMIGQKITKTSLILLLEEGRKGYKTQLLSTTMKPRT